jgi:glycerophosphoryl diester phosphodiesterase
MEVYVWTVNDPYLMSAMMSRNVDGIITDDPGLAREVLEIRSRMDPVQRLLVGIGSEIGVFSMTEEDQTTDEADA